MTACDAAASYGRGYRRPPVQRGRLVRHASVRTPHLAHIRTGRVLLRYGTTSCRSTALGANAPRRDPLINLKPDGPLPATLPRA